MINVIRGTEADAKIKTSSVNIGAVLFNLLVKDRYVATQIAAKQIRLGDAKPYIGPTTRCTNRRLKPTSRAQKIAFINTKVETRLVQR